MDQTDIDEALERLADNKAWWAQLPIKDKVQYLKEVQRGVLAQAERWVEAEAKAKGLRPDSARGRRPSRGGLFGVPDNSARQHPRAHGDGRGEGR